MGENKDTDTPPQTEFSFPDVISRNSGVGRSESQDEFAFPDVTSRNSRVGNSENSESQTQYTISDPSGVKVNVSPVDYTYPNSRFGNNESQRHAYSELSNNETQVHYPSSGFGNNESQRHYAYSRPSNNETQIHYPNSGFRNNKALRHYTYPSANPEFQNYRDYGYPVPNPGAPRSTEDVESGRHIFDPQNLATFSETLGAINTLGRYLVNITRTGDSVQSEEVPGAIYTISKNVLGRNVTDTIAGALPPLVTLHPGKVTVDEKLDDDQGTRCTMPDGRTGICDDLSNCPQLLLDLSSLRQSICFKSLFVPGVCCPRRNQGPA